MRSLGGRKGLHMAFVVALVVGMVVLLLYVAMREQSKGHFGTILNTSKDIFKETKEGGFLLFFLIPLSSLSEKMKLSEKMDKKPVSFKLEES